MDEPFDYANTGIDIQYAKVKHGERFPDKRLRPDYILWGGIKVKTYDWWDVPKEGMLRLELGTTKDEVEQGVDIKLEEGWITLEKGEQIPLLRTWKDDRYEDVLEYPFTSKTGRLLVYNVTKCIRGKGAQQIEVEERWTGNAGFWVEQVNELDRIYHCSHAMAETPDFESFLFRLSIISAKGN